MTHCQLTLFGSLSSNTMCRMNSRPRAGPGGPGVWRPAPAQLPHRCQAHVGDSSVAIGALDQHGLDERAAGGPHARQPGLAPGQEVEQGGETLDSGQVHFVHLVLYHGGQDLSQAFPSGRSARSAGSSPPPWPAAAARSPSSATPGTTGRPPGPVAQGALLHHVEGVRGAGEGGGSSP